MDEKRSVCIRGFRFVSYESGIVPAQEAADVHDLLWFVPLDWHDQLFLQVDSLSFHLVQISPVTSLGRSAIKIRGIFVGCSWCNRFKAL